MEEAPEKGKELSHSAPANGMNEYCLMSDMHGKIKNKNSRDKHASQ
jgi:hypothetical protein